MDNLLHFVQTVNSYLSDYILVILLIGVGLWYSIKTNFVQVRCFGEGMKKVFGNLKLNGEKHESGMSSFQALATAIAAQVGTGNIVGASGAILTGGPGAIFWMWVIAFFGMATIYAEAVLAQKTRIKGEDGQIKGGPVYYITTAFKGGFGKFLAGFFAIAIILALGFFGCMVQSNSIGSTMQTAFGVPSWIVGLVLVAICGFIFIGGDLPARRSHRSHRAHQVCPRDLRHDLQVCLRSAGHHRRWLRLCHQDRHFSGCKARPVLQ